MNNAEIVEETLRLIRSLERNCTESGTRERNRNHDNIRVWCLKWKVEK